MINDALLNFRFGLFFFRLFLFNFFFFSLYADYKIVAAVVVAKVIVWLSRARRRRPNVIIGISLLWAVHQKKKYLYFFLKKSWNYECVGSARLGHRALAKYGKARVRIFYDA